MTPATNPIQHFLSNYSKPRTRTAYRSGIFRFFDLVGKPIRQGYARKKDFAEYEKRAETYLSTPPDEILDDLMRFAASMGNIPPWTARGYLRSVILFFQRHRIRLEPDDRRLLVSKLPKGGSRTKEILFDADTLRRILEHLPLRGRALALTLLSSGMRIGEALQVRLDDLDLAAVPARVHLRGEYTKTGNQRVTFMSDEAVGSIREWLKVREKYCRTAGRRGNEKIRAARARSSPMKDPRLFPFSDETASKMWIRGLKAAGLDDTDRGTGRRTRHWHMTRKYFRARLGLHVHPDLAELLMGHSDAYGNAYRGQPETVLAELYLKGEQYLTIAANPAAARETEERVREQAVDIGILQRENQKIREALADMTDAVVMLKGSLMVEESAGRDERETLENATGKTLKSVLLEQANEVRQRHGLPPVKDLRELEDGETQSPRRGKVR
jgi:integrase